jgi:hypothetical protein
VSISSFEMAAIAALLAGCSTGTCIRNSDCLSAEMCMQGECVAIATEAGIADAAIDAARADAGVFRVDAGRRDGGAAPDAGSVDAMASDAMTTDAMLPEAGPIDASVPMDAIAGDGGASVSVDAGAAP